MATGKIINNLKVNKLQISHTAGANVTIRRFNAFQSGNTVIIEVYFDAKSALSNNSAIVNFSSSLPKPITLYATAAAISVTGSPAMISLEASGTTAIRAWGPV